MEIVYKGETAADYDKLRQRNRKWKKETAVIQKIISGLDPGTVILDVPLGTGRFLPIYNKKGIRTIGLDISPDMLRQAQKKMKVIGIVPVIIGDARYIPMISKSVDYVVCIRLLNWVATPAAKDISREFHRVARKGIIVGFRSQRNIRMTEFIRFLLFDLIPTPHHLRRWKRLLRTFWKKAIGKIRHEAAKHRLVGKKSAAHTKGVKSTYHNKNEIISLFSDLDLEIAGSFYIESTASYTEGKIRPYSIYRLELKSR
jgi:ubiquinone/menaquinone biosynthesis C-methylase UbiE